MIEIKIYSDNRYQVRSSGTVQELLEGVRILDTCREKILIDIKEKTLKDLEERFPHVSKERKLELIDETIQETLESITVLSEVKNQNDL